MQRQLKRRWLRELGQQRAWQLFLDHYSGDGDSTLNCYYLRALYGTEQQQLALAKTATAWIKANSQPKVCDPIFAVWRNSEYFTDEVIWQRLKLSLAANETTLARYLIRQFAGDTKLAQLFYEAHQRPRRLLEQDKYVHNTQRHREIMAQLLPRLADQDPQRALTHWQNVQDKLGFSTAEITELHQDLVVIMAREGHFPTPAARPLVTSTDAMLALQTLAVKAQQWSEVIYWAEQLPTSERQKPQGQYWLARALEVSTGDSTRARLTLEALSSKRQYYGFWAAARLGVAGKLNANPVYDQRVAASQLQARPRFARSLELFAVGGDLNGRREWYAALAEISPIEQRIAAELALSNGLLPLTIHTANHGDAHHALHLRFPIAFIPQFRRTSLDTGIAVPTLMALTRQESAWDYQAISSAGAHGLMQLLPSTARLVAKRYRLKQPSNAELHDPGKNIALGGRHLEWLLRRYNGQLAPALAAYNAGEHRADRWLRERDQMPLDVWIETIPYRETRNYVKNVLAFQHVYAMLMGSPLPFVKFEHDVVQAP